MGADQFGYQMQELGKIKQDWEQLHEKMDALTQQLGAIKGAIEKAAATDVFDSVFSGILGFGAVVGDVVKDVKDIEAKAAQLQQTKEQLTKDLGEDAQKISAVVAEYEATERRIEEEWKKAHTPPQPQPKSPTGLDGGAGSGSGGSGGSGSGGSSGGGGGGHHPGGGGGVHHPGGGGGGGGHHPGGGGGGTPPETGTGTGDWKTTGNWDAGIHGVHTGDGDQRSPSLDGLPKDRQDVLTRAMDRVNHRVGYSQSAYTNGYRDDCSGFVSAAWGLKGPGTNTWGLMDPGVSHRISKDELQPGDALIAGGHTVIFGGWANPEHTQYIALEDNISQGAVSHVIPYPYYSRDANSEQAKGTPYLPFRRNGM